MAYFYSVIARTGIALAGPKSADRLSRATAYLQAHCLQPNFKMTETYADCGLSHSSFNALFRQKMGETPMQYVERVRMKKARFLVENEEFTTAEIAEACGFKDVKYFYSAFRKATGQTVRQARRAAKSGQGIE